MMSACKKNETGPSTIPFDPAFVGVWYSDSNAVGFEVLSDGSSKTLTVDTAGRLQYASPGTGTTGAISLTLLSAKDGNLTANVRYYVPGYVDTTVAIPGVYSFSDNNNTLSISFPNPASGGQLYTMTFRRSSIGAIVRTQTGKAYSSVPPQKSNP
jgi:hypothetical protein